MKRQSIDNQWFRRYIHCRLRDRREFSLWNVTMIDGFATTITSGVIRTTSIQLMVLLIQHRRTQQPPLCRIR